MSKAAGLPPSVHRVAFARLCDDLFDDLMMTVSGIAIHVYPNGRVHAQPPAQVILKNGQPVRDARGRPTYGPPLLRIANEAVRERWVARVVEEVLKFDPAALDCKQESAA
jgi:hypothetical protein